MTTGQYAWTICASTSRMKLLIVAWMLVLGLFVVWILDNVAYDHDVNEEFNLNQKGPQ